MQEGEQQKRWGADGQQQRRSVRGALWRVAAAAVEEVVTEREEDGSFEAAGRGLQFQLRQKIVKETPAHDVFGGVEVAVDNRLGKETSVFVWRGGVVEPNLIAALASMWHYVHHCSEPSYVELANAAILFGWAISDTPCNKIVKPHSNLLPALEAAAGTIRLLAKARLLQFPTSLDEDKDILHELQLCLRTGGNGRAGKGGNGCEEWSRKEGGAEGSSNSSSGGGGGGVWRRMTVESVRSGCSSLLPVVEERMTAVQFRMVKKRVFTETIARFDV